MPRKKKRKLERDVPNPDTLAVNMKQVVRMGVFPLVTAAAENERKHAGLPPALDPSDIITNPRAARKLGTDITK
jgi:hypothetical protein